MNSITVKTSKMYGNALRMKGTQHMTASFSTEGGLTLTGVAKSVSKATIKRVTATLRNLGYAVPTDVKVELSPHNNEPAGMTDYYDLPMAICLIALCSQIKMKGLTSIHICGRLNEKGTITDSNTLLEKDVHSLEEALSLFSDEKLKRKTLF